MTKIFFNEGLLSFSGLVLATKEQYELADRCLDKDLDIEVVRYHD